MWRGIRNIAIHEMGHYLTAVRTNNLRPELAGPAEQKLKQGLIGRWLWYLEMFVKIPYGAFQGVHKEAGSFHPSVKTQNLAVSAAGPESEQGAQPDHVLAGNLPDPAWPLHYVSGGGLRGKTPLHRWRGCPLRLPALGRGKIQGVPGKAERGGGKNGGSEGRGTGRMTCKKRVPVKPSELRRKLRLHRLQELELPDGKIVFAPWEFRNSIQGGRHTEEMGGNLSFQELMFLPLTAKDYIEAQRVTNMLQTRAIQIIQDTEGSEFRGHRPGGRHRGLLRQGKRRLAPGREGTKSRRPGHRGMRLCSRPGCLPRA